MLMPNKTSPTPATRSRWPYLVVALLATHVGAMMYAVSFINRRTPSLGVVDDYYNQAVRWDDRQALARASKELGWKVAITTAARVDAAGKRAVTFDLTDADGNAVQGATLTVNCLHPAHPNAPTKASFAAGNDGRFADSLPLPYEGFYDFSVTATLGDKTFVSTVTQWVSNDTAEAATVSAAKDPA